MLESHHQQILFNEGEMWTTEKACNLEFKDFGSGAGSAIF